MDAIPPARPGVAEPPARRPSAFATVLRRLAIGAASLALAALTVAACALSFDDLRAFALAGGAPAELAALYPAAFDVLLAVALLTLPLVRGGSRLLLFQAGFVLCVLLVAAAATTSTMAAGLTLDPHTASIVIALLPWVMLAIGLWLLLLLLAHARANRVEPDGTAGADDLLPFEPARPEPAEPPAEVRQAGPQARDAGDAQGPAGDRTADAETAEVRPAAQADEPTASGTALAASEPSGDEHAAAEPPDRPAGGPDATEPPSHEPSGAESPAPADPAAETARRASPVPHRRSFYRSRAEVLQL